MPKISRRRKGRRNTLLGKRAGKRNTRKMLGGNVAQLTAAFVTAYNTAIQPSDNLNINDSKIQIATKLAESRANIRKLIYSALVELAKRVIVDPVVINPVAGAAVTPAITALIANASLAAAGGSVITDADFATLIGLLTPVYNEILSRPFTGAPANRAASVAVFPAGPFKTVLDGLIATPVAAQPAGLALDPSIALLDVYNTEVYATYTAASAPPFDAAITAEIGNIPPIMSNNEKFIGLTAITLYLGDDVFTELLKYIKLINSYDSFELSLRMLAIKIGEIP
jgi:hypothetical protein